MFYFGFSWKVRYMWSKGGYIFAIVNVDSKNSSYVYSVSFLRIYICILLLFILDVVKGFPYCQSLRLNMYNSKHIEYRIVFLFEVFHIFCAPYSGGLLIFLRLFSSWIPWIFRAVLWVSWQLLCRCSKILYRLHMLSTKFRYLVFFVIHLW